jgi:hypothetical protein
MKRFLVPATLAIAVAVAAVLYLRVPSSSTAPQTANTRGNPTAPIEIEEWGDFG